MPGLLKRLLSWLPRSGLRVAREQFADAGLAFPQIPQALASRIKQQKKWWFASEPITVPPYLLEHYSGAFDAGQRKDYVLLAHDGHGANSQAIQYYRVQPGLGLFLHLAWGGVYMDNDQAARNIAACFVVADRIADAAAQRAAALQDRPLKVVACDFYGSDWSVGGDSRAAQGAAPLAVLEQALDWLTTTRGEA